jgi:hypothetical protein
MLTVGAPWAESVPSVERLPIADELLRWPEDSHHRCP